MNSNKSKNLNSSCLNESSILNSSVVSDVSFSAAKKKYNLKDRFNFQNMTKFQEFLNTYNQAKNVLLFLDSKNNFWELVKRSDISVNYLMSNVDNITSIVSNIDKYNSNTNYKFLNIECDSPKSKFLSTLLGFYCISLHILTIL